MTHPMLSTLNFHNPAASGSTSFPKIKRKFGTEDGDNDVHRSDPQMRVRSPPLKRRTTFPPPELMTDHSNSASDEDQTMDMDQDMESPSFANDGFRGPFGSRSGMSHNAMGKRVHGFGSGIEDDRINERKVSGLGHPMRSKHYPDVAVYPSLTVHPHPQHFTNLPPYTTSGPSRLSMNDPPSSPWSAQPFATTLPAPSPTRGLFQPTIAAPLSETASDIEKARAQHGAQCKSIPKLVMSQHADPVTGAMSMYSMCGDCGACEKAA